MIHETAKGNQPLHGTKGNACSQPLLDKAGNCWMEQWIK